MTGEAAAPSRRRFSFPRSLRLRKRPEFLAVQDRPALRVRTPSYLLLGVFREGQPTRFGLVASRRLGGAVVRNRARRLLRELIRHHRHRLPSGLDLVLVALAPIVDKTLGDLERELDRAAADLARLARRR